MAPRFRIVPSWTPANAHGPKDVPRILFNIFCVLLMGHMFFPKNIYIYIIYVNEM
jgi:hypothetical protein